jgi:hypothetical protein
MRILERASKVLEKAALVPPPGIRASLIPSSTLTRVAVSLDQK